MIAHNRIQQQILIWALAALLGPQSSLSAAEPTQPPASQIEFFELHIRPVLVEQCADCHTGDADAESSLAVNSRSAFIKGGDFGPAIIAGKAEQSLLYQSIQRTHKELNMPPDAEDRLSAETIQHFKQWIEWGAPWPDGKNKTSQKLRGEQNTIPNNISLVFSPASIRHASRSKQSAVVRIGHRSIHLRTPAKRKNSHPHRWHHVEN